MEGYNFEFLEKEKMAVILNSYRNEMKSWTIYNISKTIPRGNWFSCMNKALRKTKKLNGTLVYTTF